MKCNFAVKRNSLNTSTFELIKKDKPDPKSKWRLDLERLQYHEKDTGS